MTIEEYLQKEAERGNIISGGGYVISFFAEKMIFDAIFC